MSHYRLEAVRLLGKVVRFVPRKGFSHQVFFLLEEPDCEKPFEFPKYPLPTESHKVKEGFGVTKHPRRCFYQID